MLKKYKIGDTFINKRGTKITLVKRIDKNKWKVCINGTEHTKNISQATFPTGLFKTPFCKTVYNTGYLGDGPYICRDAFGVLSEEYVVWANMIKRCYTQYITDKSKLKYKDSVVCDEWHNYQNFAKWYIDNTVKYKTNNVIPKLDKDLSSDTKIYSPETCVILPNIINCSLSQRRVTTLLQQGVRKVEKGYAVSVMFKYSPKSFGIYPTLEDATDVYCRNKTTLVHELANEYKHVLSEKAYSLLIDWRMIGNRL